MAAPLELAFVVDVSAVSEIGVHEHSAERVLLAIGKCDRIGTQADGRLAGNAARFADPGDMALDLRAKGNNYLIAQHHRLADATIELAAHPGSEGGQRYLQFHFDGCAHWQRQAALRNCGGGQEHQANQKPSFLH